MLEARLSGSRVHTVAVTELPISYRSGCEKGRRAQGGAVRSASLRACQSTDQTKARRQRTVPATRPQAHVSG